MTAEHAGHGWEEMGTIVTRSGTVAFAVNRILGEGFVFRSDMLVDSGTIADFEGAIVMHAAASEKPLTVERYVDDEGVVTAARISLVDDFNDALEDEGEWEETGALSLLLGDCVACDPRTRGERHRIDFSVRRGRYGVERLLLPVGEDEPPSVAALQVRMRGAGRPPRDRRG